jgi:restriction system protein
MSVPSFQQLMLPLLERVAQRVDEVHLSELEDEIARDFQISADDLARVLPSGQQSVFASRLNWARSFLARAGLLEATRRGYCKATRRARDLIEERPHEIDVTVLSRYPDFVAWRAQHRLEDRAPIAVLDLSVSPEDQISASFERLNHDLTREILARVHALTPAFFERLILDLMRAMGYGGGRAEMGRALGRSGDGGVDGVIREDQLGLDLIYLQAKRYAPDRAVAVREVRDFVGGLEGRRATKGVFFTTSSFPANAHDFVARVSKRVRLIDGAELAELMIHHLVGVRVKESFEVRRIDENYFIE